MASTDRMLAVVTGGAGFIGSHLVEALLGVGRPVRVVDNLATGRLSNLDGVRDRIDWVEGDLADPEVALEALQGADVVLHQAAIPSVPRSVEKPLESHQSGPTATLNVLEAARRNGVRRVVFAASSSAYGDTEALPKTESMPPRPLSPYAAGKLAGEHYLHAYANTMGVDGIGLRYFNIFGPRQDPSSPYSGVISLFIKAIREGRSPTIYGDGSQTRDFTYVANVVRANLLAVDAPGALRGTTVNIGTGHAVSLLDLVDALNRIFGTDLRPDFKSSRAGDVRDSLAALDRARDVLGYAPEVFFEDGLRRTVEAEAP